MFFELIIQCQKTSPTVKETLSMLSMAFVDLSVILSKGIIQNILEFYLMRVLKVHLEQKFALNTKPIENQHR